MPSLSAVHAGAEASNASVETPLIASLFYLATYGHSIAGRVAVEFNRRSPDGEWAQDSATSRIYYCNLLTPRSGRSNLRSLGVFGRSLEMQWRWVVDFRIRESTGRLATMRARRSCNVPRPGLR